MPVVCKSIIILCIICPNSLLKPDPRSDSGASSTLGSQYQASVEEVHDEEDGTTVPVPFDGDDEVLIQEIYSNVKMDDLRTSLAYILGLQKASLDDTGIGLNETGVHLLRNPPMEPLSIEGDKVLEAAIKLFLGLPNANRDYNTTRQTFMEFNNCSEFPSLSQVKDIVTILSGIEPATHDMCPKSCMAFTGPFVDFGHCAECGESRWKTDAHGELEGGIKQPHLQFSTLLIGPQLQAMFRDPVKAKEMRHRQEYTRKIFEALACNEGVQDTYGDIFDGLDYLEAVMAGEIKEDDITIMFSIDGAQLYRNKASDCWMSIWVIFDRSPDTRYKKQYVLPGVIIPGPNKPKNIDSFLFPGFHHIAAIQHEGLPIWDAARGLLYLSNIYILVATSDGPGLAYLNGLVGHQGRNGCRLYCGMPGRRKAGAPTYYPVMKRPDGAPPGSDHPDVNPEHFCCSSETYMSNLANVLSSPNEAQYKKRRLQTGISKPSIFLGFPRGRTLSVPKIFGSDVMHLLSLNLPDLLLPLWRGTFECDPGDVKSTWHWACLAAQDVWKSHGERVAAAIVDIPGIYGRPPRNPAEKIHSGYKAWEYHLYLYGLGPGLLHGILPDPYWRHFCKLVRAVRLITQHSITRDELQTANRLFIEFTEEYEVLYCERKFERIHFVRQSIHALTHYGREVETKGPLICASQWTMERTIGNLTEELRNHSRCYANLTQRAIRRARINAIKVMIPSLDPHAKVVGYPRGSYDLGNGYALLPHHERSRHETTDLESRCILEWLHAHAPDSPELESIGHAGQFRVRRWARLQLPNGQKCRSLWCTRERRIDARKSRNIKFTLSGNVKFGVAHFFFQIQERPHSQPQGLAIISLYSDPHRRLLEESSGALYSCKYLGDTSLIIIPATSIDQIVSMNPHEIDGHTRYFMFEQPGNDVTNLGGFLVSTEDDEDVDSTNMTT
ncbi:hypothetical protein PAXINDRAFT_92621 [Paxillus involutus ATCC 200175]|uniref:Uncharacterized protein n=1 Tax=Paxillus involutus ATCC 200175 TaxID=664439 RepID=A0A0C9T3D5_PAXIN|nr:hypothetical protein PAXINDRAFT_92621 [Paxillus involutus ATCC 200175]